MENPCVLPFIHAFQFHPCLLCGANICHVCNPLGICGGGCELAMEILPQDPPPQQGPVFPQFNIPVQQQLQPLVIPQVIQPLQQRPNLKRKFEPPPLKTDESRKRHGVAMAWQQGEVRRTDTVRVPPGVQFYGRIVQVDETQKRGGVLDYYYLVLECIDAQWFRNLPDDFNGLNWSQAAIASTYCEAELILSPNDLTDLSNRLGGMAKLEQQAWVKVWFDLRTNGRNGVPVRVYLPPLGVTNPGATAVFGREDLDYLATRMERIRASTAVYRKLHRFQEYISV